ncbi:MAG: NCS1 family nucleobase:cation symporter-1 [Opitutaceae bacterium]
MTDSQSPLDTTSPLYNADLAPVEPHRRTWSRWHIAALWVGMAVCVPTYTLSSGLIAQGMNWWQALLCVTLGNILVLIPMTLNAHPGAAYGIPFPVLLRASFGTRGANIPALLRGFVACGWFGIQTWVGGAAIYSTAAIVFGFDPSAKTPLPVLGLSPGEFSCFMLFWAVNVYFILKGMDSIKWLEVLSAPFLLLIGGVLMAWAHQAAHGFGPIFSNPGTLTASGTFWPVFGAGLTAMVGFWATLSLNIPDFSRFARSQRDQVIGQAISLPPTMALYSFIGTVVTSATVVVFGEAIWDPVAVIAKFGSKPLSVIALFTVAIATLSTNIAANVVSPANDFSNLAPRWISFRAGGLIAAVLGVVVMPWKLMADPSGYIYTWLIGYSALLGPMGGIMIADYFLWRKRVLEVADLYRVKGRYTYTGGFSLVAIAALLAGVLPNLPGFLVTVHWIEAAAVPSFFVSLFHYAWFVGFGLSFILYLGLRKRFPYS